MRTALIAVLIGAAPLVLFSAHAQQTEALRKQLLEYRAKAEKGDADAQNKLGDYYNEEGAEQDLTEAVKWYRKAAEQNHDRAQLSLGQHYAYGHGVKQNPVEAVKWYRKAAEQDFTLAKNRLAACYAKGEGVEKNLMETVKWYRRSAELNSPAGQTYLGDCYAKGKGVEKDNSEAYAWYSLPSETLSIPRKKRESLEKEMLPQQVTAGKKRAEELRAQIEVRLRSSGK